ncbi:hypothetical protein MPH_02185 [Macrophomina phaseolina MS6]|uniref:Uncharacterized protein n=1 Tax=Macrophomina phaseolina (strain MS6) TaxID=1126212 RepID=K2S636_MACPH|nr:hypothetical protein MPH_02185 [Macrophomina phaseolina MS6]
MQEPESFAVNLFIAAGYSPKDEAEHVRGGGEENDIAAFLWLCGPRLQRNGIADGNALIAAAQAMVGKSVSWSSFLFFFFLHRFGNMWPVVETIDACQRANTRAMCMRALAHLYFCHHGANGPVFGGPLSAAQMRTSWTTLAERHDCSPVYQVSSNAEVVKSSPSSLAPTRLAW